MRELSDLQFDFPAIRIIRQAFATERHAVIDDHAALLCERLQLRLRAGGCDLQLTTGPVPTEFFDEKAMKLARGEQITCPIPIQGSCQCSGTRITGRGQP